MKTNLDYGLITAQRAFGAFCSRSDEIAAIDAAAVNEGEIDHSKAIYVDSQHEYLPKANPEGIASGKIAAPLRAGQH